MKKINQKKPTTNNQTPKSIKGITLVALVVTVVVLIILAGVTLNIVLDHNGIINKSKQSASNYKNAQTNEQQQIADAESYINQWTGGSETGGSPTPTPTPTPSIIPADGTYSEEKGINTPDVEEGMIPIKWNGSKWVITSKDDPDWYNYKTGTVTQTDGTITEGKKWANIMLSDGTYKGDTATVGKEVADTELRKYVYMDTKICIPNNK